LTDLLASVIEDRMLVEGVHDTERNETKEPASRRRIRHMIFLKERRTVRTENRDLENDKDRASEPQSTIQNINTNSFKK
jgi:hypothetical protein